MTTFNEAACEALQYRFDGEEFKTSDGINFVSSHSHIQLLSISEIGDFVRNNDADADADKIQEAKDEARTLLINWDYDEFNTGSEFFAMSDQKKGELLKHFN